MKQRNALVSAFYLSNVEYYLTPPRGSAEKLQSFYQNVAALPVDSSSLVIRFVGFGDAVANLRWLKQPTWLQTVAPITDLTSRIKAGDNLSFGQALQLIPDPQTLGR